MRYIVRATCSMHSSAVSPKITCIYQSDLCEASSRRAIRSGKHPRRVVACKWRGAAELPCAWQCVNAWVRVPTKPDENLGPAKNPRRSVWRNHSFNCTPLL